MIKPEDYLSVREMEDIGYVPTWGREARALKANPQPSKLDMCRSEMPSNVVRVDFVRRQRS